MDRRHSPEASVQTVGGDTLASPAVSEGATLAADPESTAAGNSSASPPSEPAPPVLLRGSSVGRYLVLGKVGTGGMGIVYAAYDPELDRKVALKLLLSSDRARSTARLLREAQAMARLSHPHVVTVHDVGQHEGRVFVAMEFLEGGTLAQWSKAAPRSRREIVRVFLDAGRGLAAAHAKGLVHRDFKPENVMFSDEGRVCVMDFGLVASLASTSSAPVEPADSVISSRESELGGHTIGPAAGTPAYMAPEQHLGEEVDAASDQFAFCVALYEALYGQRPFAGESLAALAFSVTQGELRPPPPGASVPGWLRRIVVRGLDRDPKRRWPSMSALLDALAVDRDRQRRKTAIATALVGAVALVPVGMWAKDRRARAECRDEAAHLAGVWDAPTRDAAHAGIVATGVPNVDAVATRVEARIQAYSDRWMSAHASVCDAGPQAELAKERHDCLDQRRLELGATTQLLAHEPDPESVATAVESIADLIDPERCRDPGFVLSRAEVAGTPGTEAVHEAIAQARALRVARKLDAASRESARAVQAAKSLDVPLLVATASLEQARLDYRLGRNDEAIAGARDSYEVLLREGDRAGAAAAATLLTRVLGFEMARHPEAQTWAISARALLSPDDASAHARLLQVTAGVHKRAGEHAEAKADFEQAFVVAAEAVEDPDLPASMLVGFGDALREAGDYDRAKEVLEDALTQSERRLGSDDLGLAAALENLSLVYADLGDSDRALALQERAAKIEELWLGADHIDTAAARMALGRLYSDRGDEDLAAEAFEQALATFERAGPSARISFAMTLVNAAIVDRARGKPELALERAKKGVEILEAAYGPDHASVTSGLGTIAIIHAERGELDQAQAVFERVVALNAKKLGPRHPRVADANHNLALLLEKRRDYAGELVHLEIAADISRESRPQSRRTAAILLQRAHVHERLDQLDAATADLDEVLAIPIADAPWASMIADDVLLLADDAWAHPDRRLRARAWVERGRAAIGSALPDDAEATRPLDAWLEAHPHPG